MKKRSMRRDPDIYRTGGKTHEFRTAHFVCQATGLTRGELHLEVEKGALVAKNQYMGYITWESWENYMRTHDIKRPYITDYQDYEKVYVADLIRMSGHRGTIIDKFKRTGEIPPARRNDPESEERETLWWYAKDIKTSRFAKFCLPEAEEPETIAKNGCPVPPLVAKTRAKQEYDNFRRGGGALAICSPGMDVRIFHEGQNVDALGEDLSVYIDVMRAKGLAFVEWQLLDRLIASYKSSADSGEVPF